MSAMYAKQMAGDFKHRDRIEPTLSAEVKHLIKRCLDPNPETRYSMKKVLASAWFKLQSHPS